MAHNAYLKFTVWGMPEDMRQLFFSLLSLLMILLDLVVNQKETQCLFVSWHIGSLADIQYRLRKPVSGGE